MSNEQLSYSSKLSHTPLTNKSSNTIIKNTKIKVSNFDNINASNVSSLESKIRPKKACKNSENLPTITYENYITEQVSLSNYKLIQIKDAAKKYKIPSS